MSTGCEAIMALIDRVRERREVSRSDPVTLEEFGYLLGQSSGTTARTKAGITVGAQRALGLSGWYRGVRYISETIAGLPCHTYRDSGGKRSRRADRPWKIKPDTEMVWFGLVEFWMMSLLHRGNAYAFKVRNMAGQVTGLRLVHPDRVKVGQTSTGLKVFQLDGRQDVGYTCREILHIPGLSYDGVVGLDPIRVHAEVLGIAAAADEYAARAFDDSSVRAYLTSPATLTTTQADEMKAAWDKHHRGLMMSHEIAVMGGGLEYKTIGLDPQQTQMLETRKFEVTEMARLIGLPPHKLYDLERATFSNIEHQAIEAVQDGIVPWLNRLEAWVNADADLLQLRDFIEWNVDGALRGDFKTRMEGHQIAITSGLSTPNERRKFENWDERDGLDYTLVPLNMRMLGPDASPPPHVGDLTLDEYALAVQKLYLGVDKVITAREAREAIGLSGDLPKPPA